MRDIDCFHFRSISNIPQETKTNNIEKKGNWATVQVNEITSVKQIPPEVFVPGIYSQFSNKNLGPKISSLPDAPTVVMETLYPIQMQDESPDTFYSDFKTLLENVFDGGVLHFDLKLDNVMREKDNGQLRLIDFDKVGCVNLFPHSKFEELETVICDKETYVNVGILIFFARYVLDGNSFPLSIIKKCDFTALNTIMSQNKSAVLENYVDAIAGHTGLSLEEGEKEPSYAQLFKRLFQQKLQ